jgi:hypothetical protein
MTQRTFESGRAHRERTRVAIGFVGYSGSGKTFSTLRFAGGMQEATGGKTVLVDSNLRRSLYYAPKPGERPVRGQTFDFEVVHLTPPFDADSWRGAFTQAIRMGATRIIGDCMSDQWEGEGGVLDAHDRAVDEMISRKRKKGDDSADWELRDKLSDTAWIGVKRAHLELRLWMWQQPVDWLLTFRAKEKIDRKRKRMELGWQPIGDDTLVYDLMLRCLLPPSSDGRPIWNPEQPAEKLLVKQPPGPIRELLKAHPQVNEELGYQVARWSTGFDIEIRPETAARAAVSSPDNLWPPTMGAPAAAVPTSPIADKLVLAFEDCFDSETLEQAKAHTRALWESVPIGAERTRVANAGKLAEKRVQEVEAAERKRQAENNK